MNTEEKLTQILFEEMSTELDGKEINPDADLVHDLELSSLDLMSVVFRIEEEFGINFDFDILKDAKTLRDFASLTDRFVKEQKG